MIAYLCGNLLERRDDGIVLDVNGVGYAVALGASALRGLPDRAGRQVRLHIHTHASADGPLQLFGFSDPEELRLFESLLGVQGVGPKVALAMVSGLPAGELGRAIAGGDVARLTQIRGVGRKTAERVVVELRGKLDGGEPRGAISSVPPGKLGDVHGALLSLGYRPAEFEAVVAGLDPGEPTADLIRKALAVLRRR